MVEPLAHLARRRHRLRPLVALIISIPLLSLPASTFAQLPLDPPPTTPAPVTPPEAPPVPDVPIPAPPVPEVPPFPVPGEPLPGEPLPGTVPATPLPGTPISPGFPDLTGFPGFPGFPGFLIPPRQPAARFEARPYAVLSEVYTDNFRLTADGQEDNFRTSLSAGLLLTSNLAFLTGQIALGLSVRHDSATDRLAVDPLDAAHLVGTLAQSWQVTPRLRLSVANTFTRSDDPRLADGLGLREERRSFTANRLQLTSDYLLGLTSTRQFYRFSIFLDDGGPTTLTHEAGASASRTILELTTMGVGYSYLTSSDGERDISGHRMSASAIRRLGDFASLGVTGSHAMRTETVAGSERPFTISTVALVSTYAIPARWSWTSQTGVSWLESRGVSSEPRFFTATALTLQYFSPFLATVAVDSGFSETFATGENRGVVETRGARLSLSYPLTPFVTAVATAFYRENRTTGIAGGEPGERIDITGGSIRFSAQLLRWLSGHLAYGHFERSSPDRGKVTENRVSLSLTAFF